MEPNLDKNPYPDNEFFSGAGGSWNGEVDGMRATYGAIEPGTEVTYSISSREVIFVEAGKVLVSSKDSDGTITAGVHEAGSLFELPVDREFTLQVLGNDKLVYGCLYPDATE